MLLNKKYFLIKRIIDIFGSFVGIIFCFFLFWWWVIPINIVVTKGKLFFVQNRVGKNKKIFKIIKFRSMKLDVNPNCAPSGMNIEQQKSMETKFGSFLRKTSIDETTQLLNIILGQMSFIGPRPGAAINEEELIKERDRYNPSVFSIKPGLTGLAQIKSKRSHDVVIKAKFDYEYLIKISFLLDVKIFFLTILKVFLQKDGAR